MTSEFLSTSGDSPDRGLAGEPQGGVATLAVVSHAQQNYAVTAEDSFNIPG